MEEREIRRKKIATIVKLYYERMPFLRTESLESLQDRTINEYLDSNLSIEDINDIIAEKFIKKDTVKDNNDDLEKMLEEKADKLKEKPIQFTKKKPGVKSEDGMVSNMIVTTLALITFSLSLIGLIVIYLLKL